MSPQDRKGLSSAVSDYSQHILKASFTPEDWPGTKGPLMRLQMPRRANRGSFIASSRGMKKQHADLLAVKLVVISANGLASYDMPRRHRSSLFPFKRFAARPLSLRGGLITAAEGQWLASLAKPSSLPA